MRSVKTIPFNTDCVITLGGYAAVNGGVFWLRLPEGGAHMSRAEPSLGLIHPN
jgi:hypothetical protein